MPDRKAAFYAAERFRENPGTYYQKIMELMPDENPFQ